MEDKEGSVNEKEKVSEVKQTHAFLFSLLTSLLFRSFVPSLFPFRSFPLKRSGTKDKRNE